MTGPDPKGFETLPNGCVVPAGKPVKTDAASSLLYNEFIVYESVPLASRSMRQSRVARGVCSAHMHDHSSVLCVFNLCMSQRGANSHEVFAKGEIQLSGKMVNGCFCALGPPRGASDSFQRARAPSTVRRMSRRSFILSFARAYILTSAFSTRTIAM